jgi:hypothetical protein
MPEHYTKNTVSASFWCNKCGKETSHRVDGNRRGPCIPCMERVPQGKSKQAKVEQEQGSLFSDALTRDKRGD